MIALAQQFPQAYERLYNAFYESVFRFVLRRIDDEMLTGDIVSQVFLKGMMTINKYEHRGVSYLAWLYRTASNEINTHYRKQQKNRVISISESDFDTFLDDEQDEIRNLKKGLIIRFLERLSPEEVTILELKYYEDCPFREIAYVLNKKESAIKMKMYRALDKLKVMYKQEGIE